MSGFKKPGRTGPLLSNDATEDDEIERLQTVLVFLLATTVMCVLRIACPHVQPGISLAIGIMIFQLGAIEIIHFRDINRFERQLAREGRARLF